MLNLLNHSYNKYEKVYPFFVIVGAGGTGGYLVQHIAQMLSTFEMEGQMLIADADVAEEKNLRNQLFTKRDVGKKKAEVLADRYRKAYQIPIRSYSESYIEDVKSLKELFNLDYLPINGGSLHLLYLPIVIGAVDNNFTRRVLHEFFESSGRCLYIDVGNEAAKVPGDYPRREKLQWSSEEIEVYENSGWSGQVVCGFKNGGETFLEPVAHIFPDILADMDDVAPSKVSCTDLTAHDPQRILTNKMAAMSVLPYINSLLEEGVIYHSMSFFHAKKGYIKTQGIITKREK